MALKDQNDMIEWKSNLRGGILALIGAIMFSTKAIFVKLAYQYDVDSAALLMLRMAFSLPFFLVIGFLSLKSHKQWLVLSNPATLVKVVLLGITGYYIASFLDLEGLLYIDASLERVILFTYPTMVVLLNFTFFKVKMTPIQWLAIIFTYIGILLSFWGNFNLSENNNLFYGSVLVFLSAIAYSVYLVGTGRLAQSIGTRIFNSVAMTSAGFAILIHYCLLYGPEFFSFHPMVYIYALLIGIFSTVIPSYIIVEAIRIVGANKSSIIGSIGPISTIALAILILGERMNLTQFTGSLIVIIGVLIILFSRK